MPTFNNDWDIHLSQEFQKEYFIDLEQFLLSERQNHTVYPQPDDVYNALKYSPYQDTNVVILGQDPYPNPNEAHGLSFSVQPGIKLPRSLNNIFKELKSDIGCEIPQDGTLTHWAEQGVLLLNTVLTVRAKARDSHKGKGWEIFTDKIIELLNQKETPVVFILWGNNAQKKKDLIDTNKHLIIESSHPSPLSARHSFFGSKPFSRTNQFLKENGLKEIDWCLNNTEE